MSATIKRLHERLHELPGMPPHSEADRLNRHAHHHHGGHHARPPRVLVAWQNWIGGLFAGRGDRR